MDLISIIMPFFKKKEYFEQSLNSVINQKYKNLEIIIIFDDTEINDLNYLKNMVSLDSRIKLINNHKNLGVARSRNIGINLSKGKYVAFIDCDDLWEINKIELQYNCMVDYDLEFSHTSYQIIDLNNNIIGLNVAKKNLNYNDLINSCDVGLSTVMVKRDVIKISQFKHISTKEDYALWLELARKGITIYGINIPLTSWRKLPNSLSSPIVNKLINAFKVYNIFEKKNLFISVLLVVNLGINYIRKFFKQRNF
jgi:teichuronic acid biosynthesis glycosyltransferase TuaG